MSHRPGHGPSSTAAADKLLQEAGYPRDRNWARNITHKGWVSIDKPSQSYIAYVGGRGFRPPVAPTITTKPGAQSIGAHSKDKPGAGGGSMHTYSAEMQPPDHQHAYHAGEMGPGMQYMPYGTVAGMFPSQYGVPTGYMDPYAVAQSQALFTQMGGPAHLAYGLYDATPEEMATFSPEELADSEEADTPGKKKKRTQRSF